MLGYARITSPISGRIGKSSVTQGALVTANQADAARDRAAARPDLRRPHAVEQRAAAAAQGAGRRHARSDAATCRSRSCSRTARATRTRASWPSPTSPSIRPPAASRCASSCPIRTTCCCPACTCAPSSATACAQNAHARAAAGHRPRPEGRHHRDGGRRGRQGRAARGQGQPDGRRQVAGRGRARGRRQGHRRGPAEGPARACRCRRPRPARRPPAGRRAAAAAAAKQ